MAANGKAQWFWMVLVNHQLVSVRQEGSLYITLSKSCIALSPKRVVRLRLSQSHARRFAFGSIQTSRRTRRFKAFILLRRIRCSILFQLRLWNPLEAHFPLHRAATTEDVRRSNFDRFRNFG